MLTTKIKQIFFISLLLSFTSFAQGFKVGAERTDIYLPFLFEKNVAIVANQTSLIYKTHVVDSLISLNINISSVFCPEHGFRGQEDAGAEIFNKIDENTGIPIISLYGKNKKPSKEQLKDIEVIVFDLQDVGVRFYTYISTLHYVIEAAAENNIEVIIFDRPNPNNHYIDGPIRENKFKSFVGMHPIPIVYAMTIGEYANMIIGEYWISKNCKLTIIEMENYSRDFHYELTIKPSPNLPNKRSINLYPSLCLFEGTNVSIGRGSNFPFQHFGAPYLSSKYSFTPLSGEGSKSPKHKGKECFGTDLRNYDNYLSSINLNWLIETYENCPKKENFFNSFFDKLAGTDKLRLQIISGKNSKEISDSWQEGLKDFKIMRDKYLLY